MSPRPSPAPFPWREAMAFGLGALRLSPDAFWAMTPRELAAALEGAGVTTAHDVGDLDLAALMRAFPDECK
jgi:uncharacterized phage protein (TIGR02216 family)